MMQGDVQAILNWCLKINLVLIPNKTLRLFPIPVRQAALNTRTPRAIKVAIWAVWFVVK